MSTLWLVTIFVGDVLELDDLTFWRSVSGGTLDYLDLLWTSVLDESGFIDNDTVTSFVAAKFYVGFKFQRVRSFCGRFVLSTRSYR